MPDFVRLGANAQAFEPSSAFVVYLHLWRHSLGVDEPTIQTSLRDIAEGTGLSKRGVQEALSILARRQLVGIARQSITDVPVYTVKRPWRRSTRSSTT